MLETNTILASKKSLGLTFIGGLGKLFVKITGGLFLDSQYMSQLIPYSQVLPNLLMCAALYRLLKRSTPRSRELILYAILIAIAGEYLFSLGFEMYTYRLENVPLYIPPGHAIIYLATISFCKEYQVRLNRKLIEQLFSVIILLFAGSYLVFKGDIFGFSLTIITLLFVWVYPRERLFLLTMYVVVAVVELLGTSFGCWHWPPTAFGLNFLESANPPTGISLFYFGLDFGCLFFYKLRHKEAWARLQLWRKHNIIKY